MITGDPIHDANMHYLDEEENFGKWLKGCPWCVVCDDRITDHRCYVLDTVDKMGTCVHTGCMENQLNMLRNTKINSFLIERIVELLEYECEMDTPHEDE